jgi:hypothetical protein
MKQITINGQSFEVRGLRLSELTGKKMRALGYGRFSFKPALEKAEDPDARLGEIMDAALLPVLGKEGYAEVDQAGGVKGLEQAWLAILAETYGSGTEEKNSPSAGSGTATPGAGPSTAAPAGE